MYGILYTHVPTTFTEKKEASFDFTKSKAFHNEVAGKDVSNWWSVACQYLNRALQMRCQQPATTHIVAPAAYVKQFFECKRHLL